MENQLEFKPINNDEAYEVSKCDKDAEGEIIIPQIFNGKPVTGIRGISFMFCSKLTNIEMPEGITYIGAGAFQGCIGLKRILIPESVTRIDDYAFEGCKNLIIDAKGYTEWPFENWSIGCTGIGNGIKFNWKKKEFETVGDLTLCLKDRTKIYEVHACKNDAIDVVIPKTHNGKTIAIIRSSAFKGCKDLTTVSIPDTINEIKSEAFNDTTIWEKADTKSIVYAGTWAVGYKGKEGELKGSLPLRSNTLGISDFAFTKQNISELTIPKSVKYIGQNAFYNCKKLTAITVEEGNTVFESNGYILRRTADKKVFAKSVINIYKKTKIDGEPLVFKNFNFKLAIIQVLMHDKKLLTPEFNVHDFADSYQKRQINIDTEGYEPIKEIKKYFKDLEIDKKLALEVTELHLDGGNEIYGHITPFWDGEDEYYDIKNLAAEELEQFSNLKTIGGTANFFVGQAAKLVRAIGIEILL
jgi:hypothetical protein